MKPRLDKEKIIEHLQDVITVDQLYRADIRNGRTILYNLLRNYSALNGFNYNPYPENRDKIYVLASCIFTDQEDRTHAIKCLTYILNINMRSSNRTTHHRFRNLFTNDESIRKLAHTISSPYHF